MIRKISPLLFALFFVWGCASTDIIESPKTTYVPETEEAKEPTILWTSRTFTENFDYLGQIKVRSLTYNGALDRLKDAGKQLRADAIIDIHYDTIGFYTAFEAFAIKYRK